LDKHRIEPRSTPDEAPIPLEARDEPVPAPVPRARPIVPAVRAADPKKQSEGAKCPHCGYSVAGLASPICPECGKNWVAGALNRRRREEAARGMRREYLIAAGLMIGGLAALAVSVLIMQAPAALLLYLLAYVFLIPIGILGFYICSWIWIGFDAPFMLTVIRLVAIYAAADTLGVLLDDIPAVGFFVPLAVYIALLSKLLDLELSEAIIVAVVTFLLRMVVGLAVFVVIAGMIP